MKDFKVLATERYSVRKFDARPVEQEKVDMLLAVARLAPRRIIISLNDCLC